MVLRIQSDFLQVQGGNSFRTRELRVRAKDSVQAQRPAKSFLRPSRIHFASPIMVTRTADVRMQCAGRCAKFFAGLALHMGVNLDV